MSHGRAVRTMSTAESVIVLSGYTNLFVDASANDVVVTLPEAQNYCDVKVKRMDASGFAVTVIPSNSDVIDDGRPVTLYPWDAMEFISDAERSWGIFMAYTRNVQAGLASNVQNAATITATGTLAAPLSTTTEYQVEVSSSSAVTLTLYSAQVHAAHRVVVTNVGTGVVTLAPASTQTFDSNTGNQTLTLNAGDSLSLVNENGTGAPADWTIE